jgi:Ca-activated chloride channel family protein
MEEATVMRFENPQAFQLLWLIPIVLIASFAFERRARKQLQKALGEKLLPFLSSSTSQSKRMVKLFLRLGALACFILALARPQMGQSKQEVKAQGVEMVIAFDVSTSMLAEDVKPSRLEHAKSEVMKLLDLLSGDKVGLVAFAGSSTLISPLTNDKNGLKMFVESLSTESVENQGTDFKRALEESRTAFERGGTESDENLKVSRVVLLISDGEDQEEGAMEIARKFASDGVRIFAIAFGTERGAPIPLRDERGFLKGYKRDRKGQNVMSVVHGDFLKSLAETTHGTFHHATYGGPEAQMVRDDLDKLQKAEFASSLATNYDEKFQIPLAIGLLLALADLLMGERKAKGRIWRGRFEASQL